MPQMEDLFAVRNGVELSRGKLWADVRAFARRLPDRAYLFNLCEDRYLFCVTLLAAMLRRQVCLLPPSAQPGVLHDMLGDFPNCYQVSEKAPEHTLCPWFPAELSETTIRADAREIEFDPGQIALIAFTSGTTGRPKPCPKTWGTFRISAQIALRSLGMENARLAVVSTTPPQHMYGLETSIFWPLFSSFVLHAGWPFYPEDVRRTVREAPLPCLLASTPVHLRALFATEAQWPNLQAIICSTANLSQSLAMRVEQAGGARLWEIYGSTETLSFACRATARETVWRPYSGVKLYHETEDVIMLSAPHIIGSIQLQDLLCIEADGDFSVLGRSADMVKIGGKRVSLAELKRRLTEIDGVEDGLCLVVADEQRESRVVAVVVSKLSRQDIVEALRPYLDEVFLPKRIEFVAKIPRNTVGKVARSELEKLLANDDAPRSSAHPATLQLAATRECAARAD